MKITRILIVEDVGIAYEGGYAEWEISNVTPNRDIFMFMRMDYVHGGWECEISVNGKKTGTVISTMPMPSRKQPMTM